MADLSLGEFYGTAANQRGGLQGWTQLAGAVLSLALAAGMAVWGYRLMVRDVSGVPVVEALQGPMRIQPADPGGEQMPFQGLSVNEIAAAGEAGDLPDELVLAPEAPQLLDHDLAGAKLSDQPLPDFSAATDAAVADVLEGLDQNAGQEAATELAADVIPASVPGLSRSPRPPERPAALLAAAGSAPVMAQAAADAVEVDADSLPIGSRLVQLGSFDSADAARAEWGAYAVKFADLMQGKMRVVQQVTQNGQAIYRLRVAGFDDLADARRFCAALDADPSKPLCVPAAIR